MAIKKTRRVAIRIDMTPMVDIAFLLLIFYMATTQFKPPEARAVTLPQSHSQIELPDKDVIHITVTSLDSIYVDYLRLVDVKQQQHWRHRGHFFAAAAEAMSLVISSF